MNLKSYIILLPLLMIAGFCESQEVAFWNKINNILTKSAKIDTVLVYQPKAGFSLGVFTTGQKAGFDVNVNFKAKYEDGSTLPCLSTYGISENLCKKVGLDMSYGNTGFGYGFEGGARSAQKKRSFGLNIVGKSWGVHFNYLSICNPFTTGIAIGEKGSENYWEGQWITKEMAMLRDLSIDGYYVFNNKRFAFPVTYKVGLVQPHTAGSWMLTVLTCTFAV